MAKRKKVEDIKEELKDNIKSLTRKRNEMLVEIENMSKEIGDNLNKFYALDERMVAIKCPNCQGKGYIEENDKKQLCPSCGGPDKPYIWAERHEHRK